MRKDWTKELKHKLSEYSETPSDAVWEKIAASCDVTPSKSVKYNFRNVSKLATAVCAAAACCAVAILLWNRDKSSEVQSNGNSGYIAEAYLEGHNKTALKQMEQPNIETNTEEESISERDLRFQSQTQLESSSESDENITEMEGDRDEMEHTGTEMEVAPMILKDDLRKAEVYPTEEEGNLSESEDNLIEMEEYLKSDEQKKKHVGKRLSLGLSVGSSSNVSGLKLVENDYAYGNPLVGGENSANMLWASSEAKEYAGILSFEQPAIDLNYNHRLPIKFGISAQYKINKTFGIESGLMWTILNSDISAGSKERSYRTGTQTLHYVGIPLNLSANLLSVGPVNIYLSGGGAVEKCIKGSRNIEEYEHSKYIKTSKTSIRPKELQWSANLGAGIQINLPGSLGLYAEPLFVHRFQNGSSVSSAYSEKKNDFSLKFGLRYVLD